MAASGDSSPAELTASLADISRDERSGPEHLRVLKLLTAAAREEEFRDAVEAEVFSGLLSLLRRLLAELRFAGGSGEGLRPATLQLQLTAETFRALRNSCAHSPRNQKTLRDLCFVDLSTELLKFLLDNLKTGEEVIYEPLRCGVQFLGNLGVGNPAAQDDIWRLSFPDLFMRLLSIDDEKVLNYTSMVLHTCLDEARVEELSEPQNISLALRVMELCCTQPDVDWTVLIATQHFLKSASLVESMYSQMGHQDRVTLLELLQAQLKEEEFEGCGIPPSVARFLASSFQSGCGAVLMLATGTVSDNEVLQEALTVISLLDVLCEMSSDHKQFMFLQDHPDLLVNIVELLQQVHAIGKASKNIFSSAQNFSSFGAGDPSSHSPVVSFKAHLVRLIGNLCHRNAINQNKVRELDGIPLILDSCSVDSNNPFIGQWAVFTIRNLLEENQQNQALVASLDQRGPLDHTALQELGFLVEERDGALLLKSARKDS